MRRMEYGSSLRGELFNFVHRICQTELGVSMSPERTVQWSANPEIFAGYLMLNPVQLKFPPNNRGGVFLVDAFELVVDNGEMSLFVDRNGEGDLTGDSWIEDVFGQAQAVFDDHDHAICLDMFAQPSGLPLITRRGIHGEIISA